MKANSNQSGSKKKYFPYILSVIVVLGIAFGTVKYIHRQHHVETDDAQVEGNISPIVSKVGGYIQQVLIEDNMRVKAGDTILLIESNDYQLKVKGAEAAYENALANLQVVKDGLVVSKANISTSQASIETIQANIEAAQVKLWQANQDYKRYENLVKDQSISEQQFENAKVQYESAEKQVEALQKQKQVAIQQSKATVSQSAISSSNIAVAEAAVKMREAELEMAKLQLSYTAVTAPAGGFISEKNVQPGQLIQAGQSLCALVLDDQVWVVANFKETQLEKIKPGQQVEVRLDAFPHHDFIGKVESIAAATGSKFSLIPPDNATGNFVKVVQRVPVKITFLKESAELELLRAGMNAIVDVNVD